MHLCQSAIHHALSSPCELCPSDWSPLHAHLVPLRRAFSKLTASNDPTSLGPLTTKHPTWVPQIVIQTLSALATSSCRYQIALNTTQHLIPWCPLNIMCACLGSTHLVTPQAARSAPVQILIRLFALSLCTLLVKSPCLAVCVDVSKFFPFGAAVGDNMTPRTDDGSSGAINLTVHFPFFGWSHDKLYVSTFF